MIKFDDNISFKDKENHLDYNLKLKEAIVKPSEDDAENLNMLIFLSR